MKKEMTDLQHDGKHMPVWLLPFIIIESVSLAGGLLSGAGTRYTLETLPVYAALSLFISLFYERKLKYLSISILMGITAGEVELYFISYLESRSGQGTMNGAYALLDCACRGIAAGASVEMLTALLRQYGKEDLKKSVQRRFRIVTDILEKINL